MMDEIERWQAMMASCRKACKIAGLEFEEPEFLNWFVGRRYFDDCWAAVRRRRQK